MTERTVLITGCSSGIGRAAAIRFAERGYHVVATARNSDDLSELGKTAKFVTTRCDVSDENSCRAAIEFAIATYGGLDVLVNNAGFALIGPVESVALAEARKQFEVNTFGAIRMIQLALPHLRKSERARIVQVSSIAGRMLVPLGGWYSSSKFALEALNDALRFELEPQGIRVISILPGPVLSDFVSNVRLPNASAIDHDLYRRYLAHYEVRRGRKRPGAVTPEVVADLIIRVCERKHPKPRYIVTNPARLFNFARKFFSDRAWDRLTKMAYGFDEIERDYHKQRGA